jgi:hypothetical protein
MEFSEKEALVLMKIGELGPLTGYQIHRKNKLNLMSNAYWESTRKKFLKNKLIKEIKAKGKKPYWLTGSGVKHALLLGADPKKIKKAAPNVYKGKSLEGVNGLCDLVIYVGINFFKQSYSLVDNGVIDLGAGFTKLAESGEGLKKVLDLYPEQKKIVIEALDKWREKIT